MLKHHEPYIGAGSYEELKKECGEENVAVEEAFYSNEETKDKIVYQFELEDIKYSVIGDIALKNNVEIPEAIFSDNKELLDIVKMIIKQRGQSGIYK